MHFADWLPDFLNSIWTFISSLTLETITIFSLIVSILIYALTRNREIRMRRYETKKEKYKEFLDVIIFLFRKTKEFNSGKIKDFSSIESKYFEAGSNLSIYASKKLYNEFCFFKRITSDKAITELPYYDKNIIIYSIAKMYKIIRKEAGLNNDIMSVPKSIYFAIYDITKPDMKVKYYKSIYSRYRIKAVLFGASIKPKLPFLRLYYGLLKPIFFTVYIILFFIIKYLLYIPVKFIIERIIIKPIKLLCQKIKTRKKKADQ